MTALTLDQAAALLTFLRDRVSEDVDEARALPPTTGRWARLRSRELIVEHARAKSAVLDQLETILAVRGLPSVAVVRSEACAALTAMGSPYVGHPAYQREWAGPRRR